MAVKEVFSAIMIFSFVSIIFIFIATMQIGIYNDYILFNLQDAADSLYYNQSMLTNQSIQFMQATGDRFTNFNFNLDGLWLFIYISFWISSLVSAYLSEKENYFSFLGMLFYGTMFMLFILTILYSLTDWFRVEILLKIMPYTVVSMPMFYYYLSHVGIFSLAQIIICMVVNMMDFDFVKIMFRKKQEKQAFEDNEVV